MNENLYHNSFCLGAVFGQCCGKGYLRYHAHYQALTKTKKKEKTGKTCDFSGLEDYTSNLSNFFEDLKKLDEFAQYIKNKEMRI